MKETASAPAPRRGAARWIPLLVLVVFVGVAVLYGADLRSRAEVGEAAPDFTLPDIVGREVALTDFRGKPVILNFWATWCPTCRYETPAHQAFVNRHGDEVAYVAINLREPEDKVRRHRDEFAREGVPLGGRVELLDRKGKVFSLFRYTGTPETWVIDAEGRAVHHFIGGSTYEDLVAAAEAAGARLWLEPDVGWIRAAVPAMGKETPGRAVWLGTDRGLYLATARGDFAEPVSVEPAPVPVDNVRSVAVDPEGRGVWAVGQWGGEGGQGAWTLLRFRGGAWDRWDGWDRFLEEAKPLSVAVGPGAVYVWTADRGLLVSEDDGRSWRSLTPPFQPETPGVAMAVDPENPRYVLSAGPGGVWRSRDGGATWERTGIRQAVLDIAFDRTQAGRVYFVHEEGVLVSGDGGRTASVWKAGPQRRLAALALGTDWEGPVALSPDGDVYVAGSGAHEPWQLRPAFFGQRADT